jgi:hypothetical protein
MPTFPTPRLPISSEEVYPESLPWYELQLNSDQLEVGKAGLPPLLVTVQVPRQLPAVSQSLPEYSARARVG